MNFHTKKPKTVIYILTFVASFILTGKLSAQVKIGIKASTPTLSSKISSREYWEPINKTQYDLTYISTKNSYSFGMSLYKDLSQAFLLTDILFRSTTVEYDIKMSNNLRRESSKIFDRHKVISVPIIAGFKKENFKMGLGPVFNIKANSNYGLLKYEGFNLQNRKLGKAIQFLVGVELKNHVQIDLRHELSFDSEGDDYNIVGNPLKIYSHPQSFSVSVGVFL